MLKLVFFLVSQALTATTAWGTAISRLIPRSFHLASSGNLLQSYKKGQVSNCTKIKNCKYHHEPTSGSFLSKQSFFSLFLGLRFSWALCLTILWAWVDWCVYLLCAIGVVQRDLSHRNKDSEEWGSVGKCLQCKISSNKHLSAGWAESTSYRCDWTIWTICDVCFPSKVKAGKSPKSPKARLESKQVTLSQVHTSASS